MENRKSETAPDELEVIQVLGVDSGMRIDLERVVVMCGIFEQAIERIELPIIKAKSTMLVRRGNLTEGSQVCMSRLTISCDKRKKNSLDRPP